MTPEHVDKVEKIITYVFGWGGLTYAAVDQFLNATNSLLHVLISAIGVALMVQRFRHDRNNNKEEK